jgi:1-acyl-sn-glycerol-3-phosphate acyltransferase
MTSAPPALPSPTASPPRGEPLGQRWRRRALSLSAYTALGLLVWALSPALLLAAALIDATRRGRWIFSRVVLFFMLYLACELAGVLASAWIWLTEALPKVRDPARFERRNFALQCAWTGVLGGVSFRILGLTIQAEGADQVGDGPMIVLMRHASVADSVLPSLLISRPRGVMLRYVLKRELRFDPCLDIVGHRLKNHFVNRDADDNRADLASIRALAADLTHGQGALIYPEGTRFTPRKRAQILAKLKRASDASGDTTAYARAARLQHTLPPRLGGTRALLDAAAGRADVVFCAHTGLEPLTSFWELSRASVAGQTVHVKLWRVPAADVPSDPTAQAAWLHSHWEAVDAFVAAHALPAPQPPPLNTAQATP